MNTRIKKFNIRLLKPNFTIDTSLKKTKKYKNTNGIPSDNAQEIKFEKKELNDNLIAYIEEAPQHETEPWWKNYLGIDISMKQKFAPSCLLFVTLKDEKRILAYSFGYGHTLLKSEALEDNFGLNVTLNIIDGEKLKSLCISSPSENTKQKLETSSIFTDLNSYDFSENKDFIEKLSGAIKEEYKDWFSSSTGKDSLSIKTKIQKDELVDFSKKLLKRFESEDYKKDDYLKNINKVGKATSSEETQLFNKLLARLQQRDFQNVFLADYEIIQDFYSYKLGKTEVYNLDTDIFEKETFLQNNPKKNPISVLDKTIKVKTSEDDTHPITWPIKKCLVAEEILDKKNSKGENKKKFFLSKGKWYFIEKEYLEEIEENIKNFEIKNPLGDYLDKYNTETKIKKDGKSITEKCEGLYNLINSNEEGNFLFDKKTVPIKGKEIELCDIYNKEKNIFFHIKRKNHSASLSHLWNQGLVSEQIATIEESSKTTSEKPLHAKFKSITNFDLKPERKIYFGIVSNSKKLPIFSEISFMNTIYVLKAMSCKEENIKYFYIEDLTKEKLPTKPLS
ncbi:MAG: TIGR04141 family sporadically distributed protein [Alphaproteobacteria bacterium]|nr:TIGR04141 family sporadically distributed protein [Alphaproteobacteria bacterium]